MVLRRRELSTTSLSALCAGEPASNHGLSRSTPSSNGSCEHPPLPAPLPRIHSCWSSLRMCRRYGVHASHPYNSVGSTTAQYPLMWVPSRTPRSLQRHLVSFPNDPLSLPIRDEISSSISAFCDIVLPK